MSDCCNSELIGFPTAPSMGNMSMNWPVVWAEIAAIQQAILVASSNCVLTDCNGNIINGGGSGSGSGGSSNVCIGGNTPMTFVDGISSVKVTNGGMGYYTDVPSVKFIPPYNVTIPPADQATGVVSTNGSSVLSISVTDGGLGYQPTQSTGSVSSLTGTGAILAVVVGADGSVYGVTVINGGTGYVVTDAVDIVRAIAPNAAYINANAVIGGVDPTTGAILFVNVMNPGNGYEPSLPEAIIVSTLDPAVPYITGTGFQSFVLTDPAGTITSVIVLSSGFGYSPLPPQFVISDSGTGAKTKVNLSGSLIVPSGNSVTTIDVLQFGNNYTQNATGTVINPPTAPALTTPATIQIIVPINPFCTNPNLYYQVWAGTITNRSIQAQLDYVLSYFTKLGYTIKLQTNPETGTSLMWCICW